jgi:hypothetical protein
VTRERLAAGAPYLIAAAFYVAVSLLAMRAVLPSPGVLLQGLPHDNAWTSMDRHDQRMVLATVIGNARRLLERPSTLRTEGQCYPLPYAYALGEHMFGPGLLAAAPLALTGEPILAYNAMLFLTLWIPAMGMFAYVYHLTGNGWAAFVSGLLFGFSHVRVTDPVHPFVHGDLWVPLALLFLHRLFDRVDWTSALLFAAAASLEILESVYPLIATILTLGVYLAFLVAHDPRRLRAVAVKLSLALGICAAVAWLVLGPYLSVGPTWGVLRRSDHAMAFIEHFLPGHPYFPGAILLLLALLGLADRARGPRSARSMDPRLALSAIAFLCFWCALYALPIPWTGVELPSPLLMLRDVIPGVSAGRSLSLIKNGALMALAGLAGYGVASAVERMRPAWRLASVATVSASFLIETFSLPVGLAVYGFQPTFVPYRAGALPEEIRLLSRLPRGAVADLPLRSGDLAAQSHLLQWVVYHGQSTAACYNSFDSPVQGDIDRLIGRLPEPAAAEELAALGFRTVVVHGEYLAPDASSQFREHLAATAGAGGRLTEIGESGPHAIYHLEGRGPVEARWESLRPGSPGTEVALVAGPQASLDLTFTNTSGSTYVHPAPIAPSLVHVRWRDQNGVIAGTQPLRILLPLALASGDVASRTVDLPVPVPPGSYTVEVALDGDGDPTIASRRVRVVGPESAPVTSRVTDSPRAVFASQEAVDDPLGHATASQNRMRDRPRDLQQLHSPS